MDKTTIKIEIIRYLEANGPKFGGQIEDYIRQTGAKSSNTSRRCRELVNSGVLERELVKVEGVPNKVVRYLVKPFTKSVLGVYKETQGVKSLEAYSARPEDGQPH